MSFFRYFVTQGYKLYPYCENLVRGDLQVKNTQEVFSSTAKQIDELLNRSPDYRKQFQNPYATVGEPNVLVTPKKFVIKWFGLYENELLIQSEISNLLNKQIDKATSALEAHVRRTVNPSWTLTESGVAYKLELTDVYSTQSIKGGVPLNAHDALFTEQLFIQELRKAGIPPYYIPTEGSIFTPKSIQELFRARAITDETPDMPLAIIGHFLLFLEGDKWDTLMYLYNQNDKKQLQFVLVTYIKNFFKQEAATYGFKFYEPEICSHCQQCDGYECCTKANGTRPALNQKEKVILSITKPMRWVSKFQDNKE